MRDGAVGALDAALAAVTAEAVRTGAVAGITTGDLAVRGTTRVGPQVALTADAALAAVTAVTAGPPVAVLLTPVSVSPVITPPLAWMSPAPPSPPVPPSVPSPPELPTASA